MLNCVYVFRGLRRTFVFPSRVLQPSKIIALKSRIPQRTFCNAIPTSSSGEAKTAVDDDFTDFIEDIRKDREVDIKKDKVTAYLQKVKDIDALQLVFKTDRPTNANETSCYLFALSRAFSWLLDPTHKDYNKASKIRKMQQWIRSEDFCSMIHAHILSEEAQPEDLLTSLSSFFHILGPDAHEYKMLKNHEYVPYSSSKITPPFGDILYEIVNRIEKILYGELNVDIQKLILLHTRIRQNNVELNQEFENVLEQALMSKISEAENSSDITSLFLYLKPNKETPSVVALLQKIEQQLPVMNLGELISILQSWTDRMKIPGNYTWRNHPLFKMIIETVARHETNLTPQQMITLCNINRGWIMDEIAELVPKICDSYCLQWEEFKKWDDVSTIANFFGKTRVTYRQPWKCLIKWVYRNLDRSPPPINELTMIFSSCALSNVDRSLLSVVANRLARNLNPMDFNNDFEGATKWLNVVYNIAIADALTPKLASTVLNSDFLRFFNAGPNAKKTFEEKTEEERTADFVRFFHAQKLLQLNFVSKIGKEFMGEIYTGPTIDMEKFIIEDPIYITGICSKLKFGKQGMDSARNFRTNFNVYCEAGQLRLPPFLDLITGVFIDSVVYWDSKNKCPVSVLENHKGNQVEKVAILYFVDAHMTKSGTGEKDGSHIRLLGPYQFQVNLLQKAGYKVLVITERDLQAFGSTPGRHLEYITNELKKPSGKYLKNENWGSLEQNDFVKFRPMSQSNNQKPKISKEIHSKPPQYKHEPIPKRRSPTKNEPISQMPVTGVSFSPIKKRPIHQVNSKQAGFAYGYKPEE